MKAIAILMSAFVLMASTVQAKPEPQPSFRTNVKKIQQTNFSAKQSALGSLNVHRSGKNAVAVCWTTAAQGIAGFIVERSYDGNFFEEICILNCDQQTSRYRHLDSGVYPGYLYYRVVAVMQDGTEEVSPTEMLRIVQRK